MANNNSVQVYPDPDGNKGTSQPVKDPCPELAGAPASGTATNAATPSASPAGSN